MRIVNGRQEEEDEIKRKEGEERKPERGKKGER